jgi:molybdopterin molybdotransferase
MPTGRAADAAPAQPTPAAEALARAGRLAPCLAPEWVPLAELAGRRLAAAVVARRELPPADTSAMDGWAVRAADAARPLRIVSESAAGHAPPGRLGPGEACAISTGGLLPDGADAVLRREDGRAGGDRLVAMADLRPGADVRHRGDDLSAGQELLPEGSVVAAHEVSVVAAAGHEGAFCRRRPQVVVAITGDEVVAPGGALPRGGVIDCNMAGVAAQARAAGALVGAPAHIADDRAATIAALDGLLEQGPDLLVTVGGISHGVHDHVGPALEALGAGWELRGVAMRPGHPVGVAVRGATVVLALPGNPAAAAVAFHLLGRALLGTRDDWPRRARFAAAHPRHPRATAFVRCAEGPHGLVPLGAQGSAQVSSLARARVLAWVEAGRGDVAPGEAVPVSPMP